MTRLQEYSKYHNDINLHIKTQGYSDGERLDIDLETHNKIINIQCKIHNNKATITNVFNT
ncbi:hypothetical protein [Helicobacter saguini]|nr:hypothetical protein [Helicobacter saguini]